MVALSAAVGLSACGGTGLVRQYEYDEDIYLAIDGSATIYLNASVPALVNLHGMDLDIRPTANVDRAKVRRLFWPGDARAASAAGGTSGGSSCGSGWRSTTSEARRRPRFLGHAGSTAGTSWVSPAGGCSGGNPWGTSAGRAAS
jgi:hypothetical protein